MVRGHALRTVDAMRSLLPVVVAVALGMVACSSDDAAAPTSAPTSSSIAATTTTTTTPTPPATPTPTPPSSTSSTSTTAPASTSTTAPAPAIGVDELAGWLATDAATNPTSPGELVTVLAPGTDVSAAGGSYDIDGAPLDADASFRIASVTKTFTSAAVLRLVEQGVVSLDDSLVEAGTPAPLLDLLRADGYAVDEMTVAQVLNHSSGLFDYAFGAGSPFVSVVTSDPAHVWTREEQVAFAMEHGDPVGAPGQTMAYSDTGYVILGAIIEAGTGLSLGDAYASLLHFDELGMEHTFLQTAGSAPASPLVVQRFGDIAVPDIDPSVDLFGGGGLVSTTHDLAVFYRALWAGGVFDDASSWTTMTAITGPDAATAQGIFAVPVGDLECWFHNGFWGVEVITCPSVDITFARSWNQSGPESSWDYEAVLAQVFGALGAA
jgi:D-alanyl-D-alanine carboxypeptidase